MKEHSQIIESFAQKVAEQYHPGVKQADQPFFNFSPANFLSISAGRLKACAEKRDWAADGGINSPRGKIILIGGEFHFARDAYETYRGPTTGVELNAEAVDSDLYDPRIL